MTTAGMIACDDTPIFRWGLEKVDNRNVRCLKLSSIIETLPLYQPPPNINCRIPAVKHFSRTFVPCAYRAPLFMSQVDTKTMRLIRATEQIVVPERGAMLGNFGVVTVSPHETWITVGEGMHKSGEPEKHGGKGRVWASKIKWTRPNELRLP